MNTICGADCEACSLRTECRGCEATCGRPFGGACTAAEYIKARGREEYAAFKQKLLDEINACLRANGIPQVDALFELAGAFINLAYPLPNGETVKFLDDRNVYLGTRVALSDGAFCGVVADADFILVGRYRADGAEPELIAFQKRPA